MIRIVYPKVGETVYDAGCWRRVLPTQVNAKRAAGIQRTSFRNKDVMK